MLPFVCGINISGPFSPTKYDLPASVGPPSTLAPSTTVSTCSLPLSNPTTLNFPPNIASFSDLY